MPGVDVMAEGELLVDGERHEPEHAVGDGDIEVTPPALGGGEAEDDVEADVEVEVEAEVEVEVEVLRAARAAVMARAACMPPAAASAMVAPGNGGAPSGPGVLMARKPPTAR